MIEAFLEKNIKVPSGQLVSEVELMRFFTLLSCLRLISSGVTFEAYERMRVKLVT